VCNCTKDYWQRVPLQILQSRIVGLSHPLHASPSQLDPPTFPRPSQVNKTGARNPMTNARAKKEHLKTYRGLWDESQGQNLASTVLYVPYSLDCGPCSRSSRPSADKQTWHIQDSQGKILALALR